MRKFGIILLIIGVIQLIVNIINSFQRGFDLELLFISICFLSLGICLYLVCKYRKKVALEHGKKYQEIGWGKVIGIFFIFMFGIAIVGRIALSITENTFEGQIKKANRMCPIPVAGGTGEITSIKSLDNMVMYTMTYDADAISLDRITASPETYKRVIILSSYILNGQNGNGDRFMDMIIQNNYGIAFNIKTSDGDTFNISIGNSELKALLNEAKQSPQKAMKEVLEWQIKDAQSLLPIHLDDTMTHDAIFCDSINLIYRVTICEPLTISDIKGNNTKENRNEILRELYADPSSRANIDMCAVGRFNMIYRYVNSTKTDSCEILFSHDEINEIVELPKQLKFR